MSIFKTILDLAKIVVPGVGGVAGVVEGFGDLINEAKAIATPTDEEQADLDKSIADLREAVNTKAEDTVDRLRG